MKDELDKNVIHFTLSSYRLSLELLTRTTRFIVKKLSEIEKTKTKHTLKSLVSNQNNFTKIDFENLKDKSVLKDFHQVAKKCNLKYTVLKDKENDKYIFFLSAKSQEMYAYFMQELEKKQKINARNTLSLKEKLSLYNQKPKAINKALENKKSKVKGK